MIDAVLSVGGSYYLPYQPHATPEQFHRAYPRAKELFALKRELDPEYRLRNVLWDKYYAPTLEAKAPAPVARVAAIASAPATSPAKASANGSEFHAVYSE